MRRLPLAVLFVAAAAAVCRPSATAQDPVDDPFGHSRHGAEFDEGPRQAARLMDGLNAAVHFPVTTASAEAQRFFDQGVCQQHGFWYFEAERSFRQVALIDPDCAMAYWGMALANVENDVRAAGFIAHAVQRLAHANDRERRWIDAWAGYLGVSADEKRVLETGDDTARQKTREAIVERLRKDGRDQKKRRARDLVRALEDIVKREPDDIEARAFLAVQVWRNVEFGIEIGSHFAASSLLDPVFAAVPLHPAHHYRVHLWDREKAENALASARALGDSAPGIAHQWHMAGHIYDRLHRYADAAWQQEASARVDHAFMMKDRVMPYDIHNYGHNNEWLCRSLSHTGRVHEAAALAANLIELPRHPAKNRVTERDDIAGYGRTRLLEVLSDHELWVEVVAACEGPLVESTDDRVLAGERLLALGRAQFRLGSLQAGDAAVAALDELIAKQRQDRSRDVDAAEDEALAKKASHEDLERATTAAIGKSAGPLQRLRELRRTLAVERLLAQNDAAGALREIEAGAQVSVAVRALAHERAGEHDKAADLLDADRRDHDGRVLPLARAVAALHAAGRLDAAREHFAELRRIGGRADLDTPVLERLQKIAAEFGLPADWRTPRPPAADFGDRPELSFLGPFRWSPVPAPDLALPLADGGRFDLAAHRGRPVVVVFYLGFGCSHCREQLRAFEPKAAAFAAAGIDLVAVSTQTLEATRAELLAAPADARWTLPIACDPEFGAFKAWRAYDDFEHMPLHCTALVDGGGRLRWQDVSFEPFTKVDWLLAECSRLLALPAASAGQR